MKMRSITKRVFCGMCLSLLMQEVRNNNQMEIYELKSHKCISHNIYFLDVNANPDCGAQSGNVAPLLLVLGYTNGVQVWSIAVSCLL